MLKPGKLTDEEFEKMKEHSAIGGDFIAKVTDLWDEEYGRIGYEIARHHHEKFDMVLNGQCGMFNPKIMECFKNVKEKFEAVANQAG